ncbi:MAG: RNA polymerase sigma-70 factor (ECF subfamily), partial [Mariniblastus sp.]
DDGSNAANSSFGDSSFDSSGFDFSDDGGFETEDEDEKSKQLRMTKQMLTEEFTAHRERLWRTVHIRMDPRLYGRVDPDDVLQEAYLDAMKRVGHFAEELKYSPFVWLRLIVGQTLINVHRRHIGAQKRDASKERSVNQALKFQMNATSRLMAVQLAGEQTSPSQAAMRSEWVEELTEALETMAEVDREVLTLRHFEDLSNKEVAELLGIEQKAASIRYVRAVQRLKKYMDKAQMNWPA